MPPAPHAQPYPPALDPRLKRLVQDAAQEDRLRLDLSRGLAAATDPAAAPTPANVVKRVLVLLNRDEPPADLADLGWTRVVGRTFAVSVPLARLAELAARPEVHFVEAGLRLAPALDTSVPATRADVVRAGPPPNTGAGVVVGVIDVGGLDFRMDDFRTPDGTTRVAFLWDMNLTPAAGEAAPAGFAGAGGVEYTAAQIDAHLGGQAGAAPVRHQADPGSHGTHVTATAAGNGRSGGPGFPAGTHVGVAPAATIVYVEVGTEGGLRTFADSVRVAEAVRYVFDRAAGLGRPCVINMSLGQNGGSHDGESVVERAVDRLVAETEGRAFVAAGGNEHVFRGHAAGALAASQSRALRWKVGGGLPWPGIGPLPQGPLGDRTPNAVEVWYSSRDVFRVTVTSPGGQAVGPHDPGAAPLNQPLATGETVFVDSVRFSPLNGDAQIFISVSPPQGGTVQAGEWAIGLEAVEARDGRFDAWIERDLRAGPNRFADQSFFVGNDFDPTMTLGTPATGRRSIAVANYDHQTEAPADSSGRGTTRDGRRKPEVAAPGTRIVAAHALGGQPRPAPSGGGVWPMRAPMTGTSMAAPHVTGIVALMFHRNPRLRVEQVRKLLMAASRPPAGAGPGFDIAWGYGRVDAVTAVALTPT